MKELRFETKEESKLRQEKEFLALSGAERVQAFFELSRRVMRFKTLAKRDYGDNFVVERKKNG